LAQAEFVGFLRPSFEDRSFLSLFVSHLQPW